MEERKDFTAEVTAKLPEAKTLAEVWWMRHIFITPVWSPVVVLSTTVAHAYFSQILLQNRPAIWEGDTASGSRSG